MRTDQAADWWANEMRRERGLPPLPEREPESRPLERIYVPRRRKKATRHDGATLRCPIKVMDLDRNGEIVTYADKFAAGAALGLLPCTIMVAANQRQFVLKGRYLVAKGDDPIVRPASLVKLATGRWTARVRGKRKV